MKKALCPAIMIGLITSGSNPVTPAPDSLPHTKKNARLPIIPIYTTTLTWGTRPFRGKKMATPNKPLHLYNHQRKSKAKLKKNAAADRTARGILDRTLVEKI